LFKKTLLTEQKIANQTLFKQLVKSETTKLLQNLPQGVDKSQLLSYLQDIFGSQNFQNGKYKGGQEIIIQTFHEFFGVLGEKNIVEEETNKAIEDKFGETINLVEKSFENKGQLLRKLRDIMGEKEFFPEEPGDGVPSGREGMRRDPEAIAMQNADKQARIDAIAK
ncbi:10941_t:CDS:2, partial [Funneliformis geosporum]